MLLRVQGNYFEVFNTLNTPRNPGTPGARNSIAAPNTAPAIYEVRHFPVLPAANQPAVVTARVHDPDGVTNVFLQYRVDSSINATNYTTIAMADDGSGGDAVAGDGIYSARIPGQASGTMVAFNVGAVDALGATNLFPRNSSPTSAECLVRFGEPVLSLSFGTYRFWVSQYGVNTWINRPTLSNQDVDGTFVYGNFRAVYGMGIHYAGSPYHQGWSSPVTGNPHFNVALPDDGWDGVIVEATLDRLAGRRGNLVSALEISIRPDLQGLGLAGVMVAAMCDNAAALGYPSLVAPVRPNEKHLHGRAAGRWRWG
jgi:hypothetical protein